MIQRLNGVRMLVKIVDHPAESLVKLASEDSDSVVCVSVASYLDTTMSTCTLELVNIKNYRQDDDGYTYSGNIATIDVDNNIMGGPSSAVFVNSGSAKVVVDSKGAHIEFLINISLHIFNPLTT